MSSGKSSRGDSNEWEYEYDYETDGDSFDEENQEYVGHFRHKPYSRGWRKEIQAALDDAQGEYESTHPKTLKQLGRAHRRQRRGRRMEAFPCPYHDPDFMGYCKRFYPSTRDIFAGGDMLSSEPKIRNVPFTFCIHHFKKLPVQMRPHPRKSERIVGNVYKSRSAEDKPRTKDLHIYTVFYRGPPLSNTPTTMRVFEGADFWARDHFGELAEAHELEIKYEEILEEGQPQRQGGRDKEDHGYEPKPRPISSEVRIVFDTHSRRAAFLAFNAIREHAKGEYFRLEASRLQGLDQDKPKELGLYGPKGTAEQLAAQYSFAYFNANKGWDTIDLHGLQVDNGEAERHLRHRMQEIAKYTVNTRRRAKWLEVIPGVGLHSSHNAPGKLHDFIEHLRGWMNTKEYGSFHFNEVNRGSFVLTFEQYTGPSPCFGCFYCTHPECGLVEREIHLGHSWKSKEVWVRRQKGEEPKLYKQACRVCAKKGRCLKDNRFPYEPFMIRSLDEPRPKFFSSYVRGVALMHTDHREKLCEKCKEVGHLCVQRKYLR